VSVWKWNWVLTQARTPAGTYSSQIAGGSTMWLSQSKIGNVFVRMRVSPGQTGSGGSPGVGSIPKAFSAQAIIA
jgi:hypothetical protein